MPSDVQRRPVGGNHRRVRVHHLAENRDAAPLPPGAIAGCISSAVWYRNTFTGKRRPASAQAGQTVAIVSTAAPKHRLRLRKTAGVVVHRDPGLRHRLEREARVLVDIQLVVRHQLVARLILDLPVIRDVRARDNEDAGAAHQRVRAGHRHRAVALRDRRGAGAIGRELIAQPHLFRSRGRAVNSNVERHSTRKFVVGRVVVTVIGSCAEPARREHDASTRPRPQRRRRTRRRQPASDPALTHASMVVLRWAATQGRLYCSNPRHGCLQILLDERVEIAIEDALGVARFVARAVILHHLVRVQHVAPDLVRPPGADVLALDLRSFCLGAS